jgi:DHA1 family bicyclomycin/chloramphenicol resistance-like MFS transporter
MFKQRKFFLVFILGLLTSIGPFSIDMYLPGFPDIASSLHTSVANISLSLSSFFIGISVGQFLYGPLLDRFGRKKPLYAGLILYLIATIGCSFAFSANALITWRFFQALGGCVGLVASRAMVRDLFPVEENARIFSMLMLVVGVSPLLAPTTGGYLTAWFGWRSVFHTLTGMAVVMLVLVHFYLPESRKPDRSISLRPIPIIKGFLSVMKDPQFYTYALTGSIAAAGLYAYISGSPYVFMEIFGASEKQYGWIFAFVAFGLIIASQLNSLLLRKYSSQQIIRIALFCQSSIGLLLLAGTIFHFLGLYSTIFLAFLFLACQGFTFPNSSALSLAPFARNAGTASALMGGIQMAAGAGASALVSMLSNHTALPMAAAMAACSCSALMVLLLGRTIIRRKADMAACEEQGVELIGTT